VTVSRRARAASTSAPRHALLEQVATLRGFVAKQAASSREALDDPCKYLVLYVIQAVLLIVLHQRAVEELAEA
jgi:hypothetical protein